MPVSGAASTGAGDEGRRLQDVYLVADQRFDQYLDHRARHGATSIDSRDFVKERLELAAERRTTALEEQLQDGRIIAGHGA